MLTASLVIRNKARFITRAHLSHLDATIEEWRQSFHKETEIDALIGEVVDDEHGLVEHWLNIHNLCGKPCFFCGFANALQHALHAGLHCRPSIEIFNRRNAQDFALCLEGIVASARVLDVLKHLASRH